VGDSSRDGGEEPRWQETCICLFGRVMPKLDWGFREARVDMLLGGTVDAGDSDGRDWVGRGIGWDACWIGKQKGGVPRLWALVKEKGGERGRMGRGLGESWQDRAGQCQAKDHADGRRIMDEDDLNLPGGIQLHFMARRI
jgi:hypothetical protein